MFRQDQTVNVYIDGHRYTAAAPQQQPTGNGAAVVVGVMTFAGIIATAPLWVPLWLVWRYRSELLTTGYYLTVWPVAYVLRLAAEEIQGYRAAQRRKLEQQRQMELAERQRPSIIVVNNRREALEAAKQYRIEQHSIEIVQPDSQPMINGKKITRKAVKLHE